MFGRVGTWIVIAASFILGYSTSSLAFLSCDEAVLAWGGTIWDVAELHSFLPAIYADESLPPVVHARILQIRNGVSSLLTESDVEFAIQLDGLEVSRLTPSVDATKLAATVEQQILNDSERDDVMTVWKILRRPITPTDISEAVHFPFPSVYKGRLIHMALLSIREEGETVEYLSFSPDYRDELQIDSLWYTSDVFQLRSAPFALAQSSLGAKLVADPRTGTFLMLGNEIRRFGIEQMLAQVAYREPPASDSIDARDDYAKGQRWRLDQLSFLNRVPDSSLGRDAEKSWNPNLELTLTPKEGDIVVYGTDRMPFAIAAYVGAGVVERCFPFTGDACYQHKTLDVPLQFGREVRFYRSPAPTITPEAD